MPALLPAAYTMRAVPVREQGQANLHRQALRDIAEGEAIVTDTGSCDGIFVLR